MFEFFVAISIMVAVLLLGVPVAFAIAVAAFYYFVATGVPLEAVAQRMLFAVEQGHTLLAIPFFVLAAFLMNVCGVTDQIYRFVRAGIGQFRGGLGYVDIYSSMVFAGMSGSATADIVGIGQVVMHAEVDAGFPKEFAMGLTAATAVMGPVIPPSIAMVIIGVLTDQSIGDLFLAGAVPGLIIALSLSTVVFIVSRRRAFPRDSWQGIGYVLRSALRAIPALVLPILIVGAIVLGVTSITEGAAVAVAYALLLGVIYRKLTWRKLYESLLSSMLVTANILLLIGIATAFAFAVVLNGVPVQITSWALDLAPNPVVFILVVNVLLLVIGMFLEPTAAMLLVTPIMFPVAIGLGIDPIQFDVIIVVNLMIGLITPPFGIILFALSDVAHESVASVGRAVIPFFPPMLIALLLVSYIPAVTLWLPGLLRG